MEKTISYGSNVFPGAQVDMFSGMKAEFKDPFFYLKPARQNNRSIDLHKNAEFSLEPFPILTACDTWEQLAAVLFGGFSVEGRYQGFAGGAVVKSGFAEAQEEKVKFADLLEMDTAWLDSEKYSYIVAEIPRRLEGKTDKLTEEEEKNLRESIADELERLKADLRKNQVGDVLTDEENIKKILDALQQKCGTHYVKEVRQGDDIFQIFVYEKEVFRYVCCCMDKNGWEGYQALGFRFFTSSEYCCYAGKVKMKSGSSKINRLRECLADPVYNLDESVFCLPGNQEAYRIIDEIDDVVCLEASLIPVYDVCTDEPLVYETVVQGCIAGFGETAAGPLACRNDNETDYGRLYSDFGRMDMMAALWTPMLSFSQMYICVDDLLDMKTVNRDVLKHLALCADVLEVKGMLDLRFLESITLVCRKLICHTSPELCGIILSEQAYDTMDIYCEEMEGSLQILCQDGETSGGLLYARYAAMMTFDRSICLRGSYAGRTPSEILTCPAGTDYLSEWKKNAMQTGFQTLMSAASVPLMSVNQSSGGLEVMREAWECIQWVCVCYQNAILYTQDEEEKQRLSKVYASAVSVMRNTVNPYEPQSEYIPSVSVLSFEAYEKTVDRFMELCKDYEDKIQSVKEEIRAYNEKLEVHYEADKLRDNLREFAEFFDAQNQSLDDIYKEVEKNEREIHHQISQELLDLTRQDEDITSKMEKYNNELSGKLENLNQAIKKKIAAESVKAAFQFLEALCTIVGQIGRAWCNWSLLSSAPEAERTLKRWEAFLNSMEAVNSATQLGINIDDTVSKISDWNTVCPSYTEAPTALDWELTLHEIDAEITPLEADFAKEVSEYRGVLECIVTCAKQQATCKQQIADRQMQVTQHEAQIHIALQQQERIEKLHIHITKPDWQPDRDGLEDMGQYMSVISQKRDAVLLQLISIIQLQSSSMEYQYCGKWTPVTSFTLESVREALALQSLAAIQGMQSFLTTPTDLKQPICYQAEGEAEKLISGEGVEVEFPMDWGLVVNLAHIRINAMDVRLDGITTDSGRCHVKLTTCGTRMRDRGIAREELCYNMPARDWYVVYDIAKNETIMNTRPSRDWGAYFTKPTPCQKINIRLAESKDNRNAVFSDAKVKITIWFYLEASYCEGVNALPQIQKKGETNDGIPEFIKNLENHRITGDWDIVNFLSAPAINNLWKKRWEVEKEQEYDKGDSQFIQKITVETSKDYPGNIKVDTNFSINLGAPEIQFQPDQPKEVEIEIPILTGELTYVTYIGGEKSGEETESIEVSEENRPLVAFSLPITGLQGNEDKHGKVYLQPQPESVALENIKIIEGEVLADICNCITAYIKSAELKPWYLGEVKYKCDRDYLRPKEFYFRTFVPSVAYKDVYPQMLGIYIVTATGKKPEGPIETTWPQGTWPITKEMDDAVYFSKKILWENEIKDSLENEITSLGYKCELEKDDKNNYYFKVSGEKTIPAMQQTFRVGYVSSMGTVNMHDETVTINVHFPIDDLAVSTCPEGIKIDFNSSWDERLPYVRQYPSPEGTLTEVSWKNLGFSCEFHAISTAKVDSEGKVISFEPVALTPEIIVEEQKKSFFQLDFEMVQDGIIDAAKKVLNDEIGNLKLKFEDMPVFAVSNLLFPEQQTMKPDGAYIPCDLVLTGSVIK